MKNRDATKLKTHLPSLAALNRKRDAWDGRKTGVPIDDLLSWAYRHELPRLQTDGEGSGSMASSAFDQMAKYGVRIQGSARPFDPVEVFGPPDPDALRIAEAVRDLDGLVVDCAGVDFLAEPAFAVLTPAERTAAHEAGIARVLWPDGTMPSLEAFVITGAVLGRARPARIVEAVKREFIGLDRGGNRKWYRMVERSAGPGRPPFMVEVDGYNRKARRPFPDAYRKSVLDPDPVPIVAERVEYQAWRFALDVLCSHLDMERFVALPNSSPWWPWEAPQSSRADVGDEKNSKPHSAPC